MAREYTIGEACEELRCSRKTLIDWLKIEGIDPNHLPSGEVDKRAHMIPRSLLTTLSKKHKRGLTSDIEHHATSTSNDVLSTLLREVRLLRREVEELEQTLTATRQELPALVRAEIQEQQSETAGRPMREGTSTAFPPVKEIQGASGYQQSDTPLSRETESR